MKHLFKVISCLLTPVRMSQISHSCFTIANSHIKNSTPTSVSSPHIIFEIFPDSLRNVIAYNVNMTHHKRKFTQNTKNRKIKYWLKYMNLASY